MTRGPKAGEGKRVDKRLRRVLRAPPEGRIDYELEEQRRAAKAAESPLEATRLQLKSAERLLKMKQSKKDLIKFAELMMPHPEDPFDVNQSRYEAQYFHRAIAAALQEVESGRIPRLILTIPPRHGKTKLASHMFPAWYVGRDPYRSFIFATYNQPYADEQGRAVRHVMTSPAYKQVFPGVEFMKGSAASDRLQTEDGGLLAFVGRGGTVTGRGGDLIVIDDPLKGRKEADSALIRNELWKWFQDDICSRFMTDEACMVIIQTRWHEDDLVGRLTDPSNAHYDKQEARKWKIIDIPALARAEDVLGREEGAALWPERFSVEYLLNIKRTNPRGFSALYQQQPTPEEGSFFRREMLKHYQPHELPHSLRVYAASDHAVSLKQEGDRTVLMIVGVDHEDNIYLLDVWWKQASTDETVEAMLDLMAKYKPLIWWAASDHISKSIGPFLYKRMRERKLYIHVSESSERGDKQQKAQAIHGRMSMGKVFFPAGKVWFAEAVEEILKFPFGRHDDFVDALAHIGRGLVRQVRAVSPDYVPEESKAPAVGTMAWIKFDAKFRNRTRETQKNMNGM